MSSESKPTSGTICGFIAILGAPNVGKSTLLNRFVGVKVSIVSPKVQTTRSRVLGICIRKSAQIIFVDTPGIFKPRRRLDRAMVAAAWGGAGDADQIILLVDSQKGIDGDTKAIIDRLKQRRGKSGVRIDLVLNKIDLVEKPKLLGLATELNSSDLFADIFMVSAEKGSGVSDLLDHLSSELPAGPWLFPEDQLSDMPERQLAAEITREKLFRQLHQELPYAATVETENWEDRDDGSVRIEQVIYVQRDSQKAIVLGKKGARIKSIGADARKELEEILDTRVHLFLFVKVREKWVDDPARYRDLGLDYNA